MQTILSFVVLTLFKGNPSARVDKKPNRHLVDPNCPYNIGTALLRLRKLTPPEAKYVLMKRASKHKIGTYKTNGLSFQYDDTVRMGKNAIGNCTQQLAELSGIKEWKKKTNHTLRQNGITMLVNDPNVNRMETANAAGHKSTKTQDTYTRPTAASEFARLNCLQGSSLSNGTNPNTVSPFQNNDTPSFTTADLDGVVRVQI